MSSVRPDFATEPSDGWPRSLPRPPDSGLAMPGLFVSGNATPPAAKGTADTEKRTSTRSVPASAPAPPARLPKQSKGRALVAGIILCVIALSGWLVFQSTFRCQVYGLVEGRILDVPAPWEGCVRTILVREGEEVTPGQLLLTLENPADQWKLDRLQDELHLAQAELQSRGAELKIDANLRGDRQHKALAEYHEIWGTLLAEQARLKDLEAQRRRLQPLAASGSVSPSELDALQLNEQGQRDKIEQLKIAVDQMRRRVELIDDATVEDPDALLPHLARIENLQREIGRLRQQMELGYIRATVAGKVVRRPPLAAERVASGETVVQILEHDSLETVLYVPQRSAKMLQVGEATMVRIEPGVNVDCRVASLSAQLVPPPPHLAKFYSSGEALLPVHLETMAANQASPELRLGSIVSLPHRPWQSWGKWFANWTTAGEENHE